MLAESQIHETSLPDSMLCSVRGRLTLPNAVIELHDYRFQKPQSALFRSSQSFLDLALSPRPGVPRGAYVDFGDRGARTLGDIIFIPADRGVQTEWGAGSQQSVCCLFDGSVLDANGVPLDPEALAAYLDVRSPFVRDALLRLAREIEQPGFCSELLTSAIWTEVSIELCRYARRSQQDTADMAGGKLSGVQLRQIEERIEQPGKLPAVTELAQMCGLSSRHFFRMFRSTTGTTLSDYAIQKRINRAKILLGTARPAIKEIAYQCGFETAAAFSAAFRKSVGLTPKEYRRSILH